MTDNPLTLKNRIWEVNKNQELWEELAQKVFDTQLESFGNFVVEVLSERDPKFELDAEKRYASGLYGKNLKYSKSLRKGALESLAFIGSNPQLFTNCSTEKPETVVNHTIRGIFKDADWVLWASLGSLLPTLAEAAPNEFLFFAEEGLGKNPCPFDTLFSEEGDGITGGNYMSGLLWALETLAWSEEYLVRVTVFLGELDARDPGGIWGNRPANSLTTIFLPWIPQTLANKKKRFTAVKTLAGEKPEQAWKLLLTLLPDSHQSSSGSHKPKFRHIIPEDWDSQVTNKEYWDQIVKYSELAAEIAKSDLTKLYELIKHLDHLPKPSLEKVLKHLRSQKITDLPENKLVPLWTELRKFVSKHKKYAEADCALPSKIVSKIEKVVKMLTPKDSTNLYRMLFDEANIELFEEKGDYEQQRSILQDKRKKAAEEILQFGGIKEIINFAANVKFPVELGKALGSIKSSNVDLEVLPKLLESKLDSEINFTKGFVLGRFQLKRWPWVDNLYKSDWSKSKIGKLLAILPFTENTWNRSNKLLGKNENYYWDNADVDPYDPSKDLNIAVDKLILHNRPKAAIDCLYKILHDKKPLDQVLTFKALFAALASKKPIKQMESYHLESYYFEEIIKALQKNSETNQDKLFKIEWAYLPLLVSPGKNTSPQTLEHRLATKPEFFLELIQLIYRSDKESVSKKEPTKNEKAVATNAYKLLRAWKRVPGLQSDGNISEKELEKWIKEVKKKSSKSGHLEAAMSHIGNVLINYPQDPEGLLIHNAIAKVLNAEDAAKMRNGFRIGILNSRGACWIDPMAKPEKQLAEEFKKQAEDVENAGYYRLAITINEISEFYESDAKRIIDGHKPGGL